MKKRQAYVDYKIVSPDVYDSLGEHKHKPRIRYLGGNFYLVESSTSIGTLYKIDVGKLRCSCPAGKHFKRCRHLVLALQYEDWRKRELEKRDYLEKSPI